ncbi:MAG: (deoxy)nucleoside triphosphate pyrophosphohydrolase [Clostridia bacterium]|jgi:8-oxo-dGTP diphosphatase|nr:(deoxy)nucleoside triphosphate pyrophosphohydrolase [Clostridia bacterium]
MKKTLQVVGAIIVKDGRILAVKRGESKNKAVAYKYEFPGGKIESGETPQSALKRELLEEMDYAIEVGEEFMQVTYEYEEVIVHLTAFICAPLSERYKLNEHIDDIWLLPDELNSVEWAPADSDIISKLSKIKF